MHELLTNRMAVLARMNGTAFEDLSTKVLQDAYVEELTTHHADYASEKDVDEAFINFQEISKELVRRDKEAATQFFLRVQDIVDSVCPGLPSTLLID